MDFILRSEVDLKQRNFCPYCGKTQIKRLDKKDLYTKYACWNKNCKNVTVPFIVINNYVQNEESFPLICVSCQKPFLREVNIPGNQEIYLNFKCEGKLCQASIEPYQYNLTQGKWEGNVPEFRIYEELKAPNRTEIILSKFRSKIGMRAYKELNHKNETRDVKTKAEIIKDKDDTLQTIEQNENLKITNQISVKIPLKSANFICPIGEVPILTRTKEAYEKFIDYHNNKVVILVDVPNFVRTLRALYRFDFDKILHKSHSLLLEFIDNSFSTTQDFVIRYFSKPDDDLKVPNQIITDYCEKNTLNEFFHLITIEKSNKYSDIDNYLIVAGIEVLERCTLRGFVIVSSDKDFLPVMRLANYKNVKSFILGINTPEIYEKYDIGDIKFLGILNFFK